MAKVKTDERQSRAPGTRTMRPAPSLADARGEQAS